MTVTKSKLDDLKKVSWRLDHDGHVLRLALNNPPGNVIDSETVASLRRAVAAAQEMPQLKLLVFAGEGKHFSFGASVEEHRPAQVADMLHGFHGLFRDLMEIDVPTAALVRGQCLGGGLELAAFCDWILAVEGARLGQPEIKLGVFAPVGSLVLGWRCRGGAADLLLTGKTVPAEDAMRLGLVDRVLPEAESESLLQAWIEEEILPLSATSLRRARRAARWWFHRMFRTGLEEVEQLYLDDLMRTHDAVEGIEAFLEKRRAEWTNG